MKKLIFKDSKKIIIEELKEAKTFLSRLRGLQFRFSMLKSQGLHISPCDSIHMCNMFFKIDAVFIDRNLRIVEIRENLIPWLSMVFPVKGAFSVIEIMGGQSRVHNLQIGQLLEIRQA